MEGKQIAGGVGLPKGLFAGKGLTAAVDSQVTSWGADDSPFFYANGADGTNSSLNSAVLSVSFTSGGGEVKIEGLADPIVVDIAIGNYSEDEQYNCSYFDTAANTWVVDGELLNLTETAMTCAFSHLTDLGALAGPAPSMNKLGSFDQVQYPPPPATCDSVAP